MERTYTGTDGTVGFIASWKSDNKQVGEGEQEITSIEEGVRIDFELRFKTPFEATDPAYMTTESNEEDGTLVKWGFDGAMAFPMNIMLLILDMEEELGNDLANGLAQLKTVMEEMPSAAAESDSTVGDTLTEAEASQ